MRPLSSIEFEVLLAFAKKHGIRWKSKLIRHWNNDVQGLSEEQIILRRIRNELGPNWLYSNNNPIIKELKCPKPNSHSSP